MNWAIEANDAWVASLSPDASKSSKRNPEAMVVLFGPTQVGKTTLLLTLLGVAEGEAFADVQRVLRGGRISGNSSTATPIRYGRSADDHWRIGRRDSAEMSSKEVQEHLSQVRHAVEQGTYRDTDPVMLYIPACHFADGHPSVRVSVLDLPGTHAAAPRERELVQHIAQRYVPAANLVLLVSTANRLGVFEPEKIGEELEELRGWMRSPLRYRLVTTYAFSQQSVRRAYREGMDSLRGLRDFFVKEMRHFDLTIEPQFGERIFPMEYGDSWTGLAKTDPAYHGWAKLLQEEVRQSLVDDIARSCEGETRLRISQEIREQVLWRRQSLRDKWRASREPYKVKLATNLEAQKVAAAYLDIWNKRQAKCDARRSELDSIKGELEARTSVGGVVPGPPGRSSKKTVRTLQDWLVNQETALRSDLAEMIAWFNYRAGLSSDPIIVPTCDEMAEAHVLLDSYILNTYWTAQYEKDVAFLRSAMKAQKAKAFAAFRAQSHERLKSAEHEVERNRESAANWVRLFFEELANLRAEERDLRALRCDAMGEHRKNLAFIKHDMARIDGFDSHMQQALQAELSRVAGVAREAARGGHSRLALARLCQLRLTHDVYNQYCLSVT